MLARLWHRTISCVHNKNSTVHLRRTRDHVLHIIGMAWAIDVRIVAIGGFIFNVCS